MLQNSGEGAPADWSVPPPTFETLPVPGPLPVAPMVAAAHAAVIGRDREIEVVAAALAAGRSVLLEGPPGTGKTTLLRALAAGAGVPLITVEGNAELTPSRLVGHHDPSRVLREDYHPDNFVPGPLLRAMVQGGLLYIEELNRLPEETLNVLLGAMSERRMHVSRYATVDAAPGFRVVAVMNPFDAVGTGRITPALYDRSCRVGIGYQSEAEEAAVVTARSGPSANGLVDRSVRAVRASREHPDVRIGSSVRGALDLVAVAGELASLRAEGAPSEATGLDAALTALTGRITVNEGCPRTPEDVVTEIWATAGEVAEPGKATTRG